MTAAGTSRLNNSRTLFEEITGIASLFIIFSILAVLWGIIAATALLISIYQKARNHAKVQ